MKFLRMTMQYLINAVRVSLVPCGAAAFFYTGQINRRMHETTIMTKLKVFRVHLAHVTGVSVLPKRDSPWTPDTIANRRSFSKSALDKWLKLNSSSDATDVDVVGVLTAMSVFLLLPIMLSMLNAVLLKTAPFFGDVGDVAGVVLAAGTAMGFKMLGWNISGCCCCWKPIGRCCGGGSANPAGSANPNPRLKPEAKPIAAGFRKLLKLGLAGWLSNTWWYGSAPPTPPTEAMWCRKAAVAGSRKKSVCWRLYLFRRRRNDPLSNISSAIGSSVQ